MKAFLQGLVLVLALGLTLYLSFVREFNPASDLSVYVAGFQTMSMFVVLAAVSVHYTGRLHEWRASRRTKRLKNKIDATLQATDGGTNPLYDPNIELAGRWKALDDILQKEHHTNGAVDIVFMLNGRQTAIKVNGYDLTTAVLKLKLHIEALDKAEQLSLAVSAHNRSKDLYTAMNGGAL